MTIVACSLSGCSLAELVLAAELSELEAQYISTVNTNTNSSAREQQSPGVPPHVTYVPVSHVRT